MSNYGNAPMRHAVVPLAKTLVHATHPFRHAKNHESLLEYLQARLMLGKQARDSNLDRYVDIDKVVSGWIKYDEEDSKRKDKQRSTGDPQAVKSNLPISFIHLDDMMTYFAQTFAPSRGMFYHTGKPNETDDAAQIVTLMNNHAIYAGYYREILLSLFNLLKYNVGGWVVEWEKEERPKLTRQGNTDTLTYEVGWQGNRIEAIDVYNHLRDPSVHPTRLHCDGEFSAIARVRSHYWLQLRASQGRYFNCDNVLRENKGISNCTYYRNPPQEAQLDSDDARTTGGTNWISILSDVALGQQSGYELVEICIRLNPTEFGLVPRDQMAARNRYELWRFTVLNNEVVIEAQPLNNIHGYIPHMLGVLNDDLMGVAQKSTAEILDPLQQFASFLMNVHVVGTRKNLFGTTYYNPAAFDLKTIPEGEVAARIPLKPTYQGKDIRELVFHDSGTLDTKQTLQDLDGVMSLISQFYPTQSLPSQIAGIDRAVTDQVAAVQQGANRRQHKAARLLDDSVFRPMRFAMYWNIVQFQPESAEITDFYTGKPVKINLESLRNTDLPFIIGQGLKSLDRQSAASMIQSIIFALIQAPQAAEGIDLLGLIDYWTSMLDVDMDMTQFRKQVETQMATGAATAEGNPINPATNPQAITTPIYGS